MSLEASEIRVAGTGNIWRAPLNTAFPTNISTPVNETLWTELGYTTEDGVKFSFGRNMQEIFGWQSLDPLREIVKETPRTLDFTLLQWNQNSWNLAFGGGTWSNSGSNGLYVPPAPGFVDQFAAMVQAVDGAYTYRWCFYVVQNVAPGAFDLKRTDAAMLPIQFKVLAPDSTVSATSFIMQTNDPNLYDYTQAGS